MESKFHLLEMFGTDPNKIFMKAIFWDTNLKFGTYVVQIYGFNFLAALE